MHSLFNNKISICFRSNFSIIGKVLLFVATRSWHVKMGLATGIGINKNKGYESLSEQP